MTVTPLESAVSSLDRTLGGISQKDELTDKDKLQNISDRHFGREAAGATYEITSGLTFDAVTAPLGLAPPLYAALNFGEGSINNVIAQKIRGRKWNEIDWKEVISSGVLGIVPLSQLRAAKYLKKPVAETVEKVVGKQNTVQRYIASGAVAGAGDVTIQSGLEGQLPAGSDLTAGTLIGAAVGGSLGTVLPRLSKKITEIVETRKQGQRVSKAEADLLSKQLELQEKTKGDFSKVTEEDGAEISRLIWNIDKEKGLYEEFVDYDQYKHINRNFKNKLEDKIDGEDSFYKIDDLSEPDQKKLRKLIGKHEEKEIEINVVRKRVEQLQRDNPDKTFTVNTKDYRSLAGWIPLEDTTWLIGGVEDGLLRIAREEREKIGQRASIKDVYEYLRREKVGNKQLRAAINLYNKWARQPNINQAKAELEQLESQGILRGRDVSRWRRILYYAEKKLFVEKGHKESLLNLFMRSTSSGDRLSNVFLEYVANKPILTADGTVKILPGNRAKGANKDLPLYTLMKLRGASRNLRDDFRKVIMPDRFPSESVPEEFEEVAEILYRNRMDRITRQLNPEDPNYELTLRAHSIAITDGLYAMIKRAIDGDIPYEKIEDQFLIGVRVLHKYTAQDLQNTYKRVFDATLKRLLEEL